MIHLKKTILVVVSIVFVGCSDDNPIGATAVQLEPRTVEDVTADFLSLTIQPGVNDFSLESLESGRFWNFRVIAPAEASENNRRPLVIALHGASGGSATAHQNTSCYVEPGLAALDAFIISPNAGEEQWYDGINQNQVAALTDLARMHWFVDTEKVLVTGYSNGGNASWLYADIFPQYFTASIAMASSYDPERADGSISTFSIPIYVIHSNSDELFPVSQTEIFVNKAISAGSVVEFVIVDGLSHYTPCEYVTHFQEAVNWVVTNVW